MGNYRNITVNFWNDSKIDDCFTPEDKYFYLYLLTNPHTNISGCYEISNKQIERETGYNETTVKYLINRMHVYHGVIDYSEETKEVYIYNWYKYNWTTSPKVQQSCRYFADLIKNKSFKRDMELLIDRYFQKRKEAKEKTVTDTVTVTDTEGMDTVSIPYEAPVEEEKTDKPKKHKYGEFQNVLLTEDEHGKLINDGLELMIETLSEAKARMGYKYKSDYLACKAWARRDKEAGRPAMPAAVKNSWMDSYGAGDQT